MARTCCALICRVALASSCGMQVPWGRKELAIGMISWGLSFIAVGLLVVPPHSCSYRRPGEACMLGHRWPTACYAACVSLHATLLQDLSALSPTQKCALALYNQVRLN